MHHDRFVLMGLFAGCIDIGRTLLLLLRGSPRPCASDRRGVAKREREGERYYEIHILHMIYDMMTTTLTQPALANYDDTTVWIVWTRLPSQSSTVTILNMVGQLHGFEHAHIGS